MIQNRELTMDDYLAILRRRWKLLLIPVILAPLVGFGISFAFAPKYTSQTLIIVQGQRVPEGYVKPMVTEDLSQRITELEQRALSAQQLRPIIDKFNLAHGNTADSAMDSIRKNISIQVLAAVGSDAGGASRVPGFTVNYTDSSPLEAQQVCAALTDSMIKQNISDMEQTARDTTEFLGRQVDDQKHKLDDLDAKLADFKKRYIGQLPGDEDQNLKILMAMNSQLDADTQSLNRAQQDKAYAESVLSQQLAAWRSSRSSTDPTTLQKQMAELQSKLISLKASYTDDYPDVVKTKNDIKELQKKIDDVNAAAAKSTGSPDDAKATVSEPAEIQNLRLQLHNAQDVITQLTRDQARLQQQIRIYQGKVALSPEVEEQYKQLTRDYDSAQKVYNDLLLKKSQSETQLAAQQEQQGEQMNVMRPANLPNSPSFPDRLLFSGGGLAVGMAIGFGLALWIELRDQLVRTEDDVVAVLGFPVLTQVPWVGVEAPAKNGYGKRSPRLKEDQKQEVEV